MRTLAILFLIAAAACSAKSVTTDIDSNEETSDITGIVTASGSNKITTVAGIAGNLQVDVVMRNITAAPVSFKTALACPVVAVLINEAASSTPPDDNSGSGCQRSARMLYLAPGGSEVLTKTVTADILGKLPAGTYRIVGVVEAGVSHLQVPAGQVILPLH